MVQKRGRIEAENNIAVLRRKRKRDQGEERGSLLSPIQGLTSKDTVSLSLDTVSLPLDTVCCAVYRHGQGRGQTQELSRGPHLGDCAVLAESARVCVGWGGCPLTRGYMGTSSMPGRPTRDPECQ